MADYKGYNNKLLRVNLSSSDIRTEEIGEDVLRKYIGGTSLGYYYMLKEICSKIDPLSDENRIYFTTSPITGVRFSGNGRHSVTTVSPLTGGGTSSEAGGWWGAALKLSGIDAIAVEGVSNKPVYLYVEDDKYELHDADDLWGRSTGDVQNILKQRHGKNARVLQTGPAGEKLIRFACITNELRHFNGRGGTGAVMGHKKLRAIVVKNNRKALPVADQNGVGDFAAYLNRNMKDHPALAPHRQLGTQRFLLPTNAGGMLPTYNFRDGSFDAAEQVSGEEINRLYGDGSHTCYACAVSCKRKMKSIEGAEVDTSIYGGPEYETMAMLGPVLGIENPKAIVELNAVCNAYGLDTIAVGAAIGWLIEAMEKEPDLPVFEGVEKIGWNEPDKVFAIIEKIMNYDGIGALLAQGTRAAAVKAGGSTMDYAMQVKGQDFPAHEPRGKWTVGLGMAVNAAGADHLVAAHDVVIDHPGDAGPKFGGADLTDIEGIGLLEPLPAESLSAKKVRNFVYLQQLWMLYDVLDWCKFTGVPETRSYTLKHIVEIVEMATGWKTSIFDLMKCAERTINMGRIFNNRMGFTSSDDTLPERMFEPISAGPLKGHSIDKEQFEKAVELYYQMMGWNERGEPQFGKLVELGLEELAG
ncbi:MAG: aldehyde ferredoxin oxidoreductase family protein [Spirochaetales bacterium]|uniref:Aldehyde ferredoxin oxidoreductase family protein n=1 Tax=Candidatus Thalassospirochaeta sargassi TaxID=3119039 RepID=A0AAJ1IFP0_9SPIO|nr:aldehyde ferredoxin oxidoreductase family protein [Spirochaetales bacterium]